MFCLSSTTLIDGYPTEVATVQRNGTRVPRTVRNRRLGFVFASRGAVAGAVHDAEEDNPRADRIAILVGHYAGELMKVSQIVRGPSG